MTSSATTDWLDGFERIDVGPDGGSWADDSSPWRVVLHTTEGGWDASMSVFRSQGIPPHLLVDPKARRRAQLVSLNASSYALENRSGGIETNRDHAVQVEIVGFASSIGDLTDEDLQWLGQEVLRPIMAAAPIASYAPPFFGQDAGWNLSTLDARQRMSFATWTSFSGVCGHQHVPENVHWDPGAINAQKILDFARPTTPQEALAMGYIHAEIVKGATGPWPSGRWTFYAVTADGRVDVLNDVSALSGHSTVFQGDFHSRNIATPSPVVAFTQTPSGKGYYLVTADGGVFTFGDAPFFGSLGGVHLNAPIIGIEPHLNGDFVSGFKVVGYVLLAADGGCFNQGKVSG